MKLYMCTKYSCKLTKKACGQRRKLAKQGLTWKDLNMKEAGCGKCNHKEVLHALS